MSDFSTKALVAWALICPAVTAAVVMKLMEPGMDYGGYLLPFIAFGLVAALFVAALVVGLVTRTATASVMGMVIGVPLSALVARGMIGAHDAQLESQRQAELAEVGAMLPVLTGEDRDAIARTLGHSKTNSVPRIMCVLAGDAEGAHRDAFGGRKEFVVSPAALLRVAEVMAGMNLPLDQKEAGLSQAFDGLVQRDALAQLPAWTALWDKAHGGKNGKAIAFSAGYGEVESDCKWGSTEGLADKLVATWGDKGINAWIGSGHSFVEEQRRTVVHAASEPATLESIAAGGTKLDFTAQADSAAPRFAAYADRLDDELFRGEDPSRAVKLLATYTRLSAATPERARDYAAACTAFQAAKTTTDVAAAPDRKDAVAAFEALLCAAQGA